MSNDSPDWLEELFEPKKEPKPQAEGTPPKGLPFTPVQLSALAVLCFFFCLVVGVFGWLFLNSGLLFGPSPSQIVAAPAPTSTPSPELPPPPDPPTPTPSLLSAEALPPPEPTPTATLVVPPQTVNRDTIRDITKFVEKWRQLSLPADLPIIFLTRDQLRDQWQSNSLDRATIATIQTQQEFYVVLGLVEPGVDLVQAAFESQTDLVLGYYTPEEKVMYIIAESINMFAQEKLTFAHEYTHALQDYYFDLNRLSALGGSADARLAARALPEGDAELVEQLFSSQKITQDQLDYIDYLYLLEDHPELEGVSPALGILTFFPYTAGSYFVTYLYLKAGYTWDLVNQAYQNPPLSSEQVLHPEKYLAGERPVPVTLPDLSPALGSGWREIDRDVLGEIGLLVWLMDQVPEEEALKAAAGWDGDTYAFWVDDTGRRVLVEASVWESEAEAAEFAAAFTTYMNLRESRLTRSDEGGARIWEYEGGITWLRQRGRDVLIVVASDRSMLDQLRGQF
jgi:hypothetical protein